MMQSDKYPSIKRIIQMITKSTPSQKQDLSELHFEIKYAKLKSPMTEQYKSYLSKSKNQIFLLCSQEDYKQYKIHSGASKAEYANIFKNCKQITNKISKTVSLDIKVNRDDKLVWEIGRDKWGFSVKDNYFTKLFNIIVDAKEFRVGLYNVKDENQRKSQIDKEEFEERAIMIRNCRCIRFKQRLYAQIHPFYYITLSRIVEIDEVNKKLQHYQKQLTTVFTKSTAKETNEYVLEQLNKPESQKYEIQLQLTVNGVKQILGFKNQNHYRSINKFIGDIIMKFRSLCEEKQGNLEDLIKKIQEIGIN